MAVGLGHIVDLLVGEAAVFAHHHRADPNGTRIGPNCFIMADSHIGHDSVIVGDCVIGNGVSVAGLGRRGRVD